MKRLRELLEWCGFTPSQREARLRRLLERAVQRGTEHRDTVIRVQRLVDYRASLEAGTVDLESLRRALDGSDR